MKRMIELIFVFHIKEEGLNVSKKKKRDKSICKSEKKVQGKIFFAPKYEEKKNPIEICD